MGHKKRDHISSFTLCPKVLWTLSHSLYALRFYGLCLTFWIRSHKFHFTISESFSQREGIFLPTGVEFKFIILVWSPASVLHQEATTGLFSVSNHETTRGNLMSRYLRLETPAHMCVLQRGLQGGYTFHITFLVIWILIFRQEAGEKPPSDPLYLGLSDVHTLAEGPTVTYPASSPSLVTVCPISPFFVQSGTSTRLRNRGQHLRQIRGGQARSCIQLSWPWRSSGFCLILLGRDGFTFKEGWLVGQLKPYPLKSWRSFDLLCSRTDSVIKKW